MKKLVIVLFVLLVFVSVFWPFMFGLGAIVGLASLSPEAVPMDNSYVFEYERGDKNSENKILAVKVFGPILDQRSSDLGPFEDVFGQGITYGYEVKEQLMQAAKDDSIDGVVIEINSPGGTVTGSQAIADGIKLYHETGRPIISFGSGLVASGGYWVAAATDKSFVDSGSLVGSIGVIGGMFPVYKGVTELGQGILGPNVVAQDGIDMVTITAGEGKDFGNPFRTPTEKELRIAQQGADDIYQVFVDHVASHRNLTPEKITSEIGAYVYGEQRALALELIDGVRNREQVYQELAQALNLGSDFQVVSHLGSGDFLATLLGVAQKFGIQPHQVSQKKCGSVARSVVYYGDVSQVCGLF